MKILILILVFLNNFVVYAKGEPQNEDVNFDHIVVVQGKDGLSDSFKKPFEIFNNKELKGKPAFEIDNFKVSDLRLGKPIINNKIDFIIYNSSNHFTI